MTRDEAQLLSLYQQIAANLQKLVQEEDRLISAGELVPQCMIDRGFKMVRTLGSILERINQKGFVRPPTFPIPRYLR